MEILKPISAVVDNAFVNIDAIFDSVTSAEFFDVVSPVDGVVYPTINNAVEQKIKDQYIHLIETAIGKEIKECIVFARAMYEGTAAPNRIHSDVSMGTHAAHLYLSKRHPDSFGTSFWRHKTQGPVHDGSVDVSQVNSNDISQWEIVAQVLARYNRVAIHPAEYWHLANPINGWGDNPKNCRLVLTAFFQLA